MGLAAFESFLRRHTRIALDTSIFIYQMQAQPKYSALTGRVFEWLEVRGHAAITSTVTWAELLVVPYRDGDQQGADDLVGLLSTLPNLSWIPADLDIADLAARARGVHRLRTPDALQAATALYAGATGLVTNDPIFKRLDNIEVAVLDEFL